MAAAEQDQIAFGPDDGHVKQPVLVVFGDIAFSTQKVTDLLSWKHGGFHLEPPWQAIRAWIPADDESSTETPELRD